jgi:hypothetical protein
MNAWVYSHVNECCTSMQHSITSCCSCCTLCSALMPLLIAPLQALRQATAYAATGDHTYALNSIKIISGWAVENRAWGRLEENGPLEAAWVCAAMGRALSLLGTTAPSAVVMSFREWAQDVLLPQVDFFDRVVTPLALARGEQHVYGNCAGPAAPTSCIHASCFRLRLGLCVTGVLLCTLISTSLHPILLGNL